MVGIISTQQDASLIFTFNCTFLAVLKYVVYILLPRRLEKIAVIRDI